MKAKSVPPWPASILEGLAEKFTSRAKQKELNDRCLKPLREEYFDQPVG
jgi:hypothetical protein